MTAAPANRSHPTAAATSWSRPPAACSPPRWWARPIAAVPLYNWFCRTTGFAGTTQVASAAPAHALDRKIVVRFDAKSTGGLPGGSSRSKNSIEVRIGDVVTVNYAVTNKSARETVGQASLQRIAADRRRLLRQDQLLLLHRAALSR